MRRMFHAERALSSADLPTTEGALRAAIGRSDSKPVSPSSGHREDRRRAAHGRF